jgi:serine/threonine protein kinase
MQRVSGNLRRSGSGRHVGGLRSGVYTERVEAGRRIGKYVLDERIAVGGMAEVWAAHVEGREGFVKPVALKFILESFSGDPELERLFVNEARIAARLQHANLVTVFDFDKFDDGRGPGLGRYYIAMERVEGQDLRRLLEAAQRAGYVLPVGLALHVAGEILKALRYVHEKREAGRPLGLVHRDVSPHNVLVAASGEVKLSDFGIAKAREHSARTTKRGGVRGKIAYASPEQLASGVIDHRTDQFAAGVTIWELLAGRRLFDGGSDLEILGKVARCAIPPFAGQRDVPPAVEAVVRRMLAPEPRARFPTTAEALAAVLALASYSPDGAPLGELVRGLFPARGAGLSRTVPLPAGSSAAAAAPTRTMDRAPLAPLPVGAASPGDERSSTAGVRSRHTVAKVLGALALGVAAAAVVIARPAAAPPPATTARPSLPSPLATTATAAPSPHLAEAPALAQTPEPVPAERRRAMRRPVASRPASLAPVTAAPVSAPPAPTPPLSSSAPVPSPMKRSVNGSPIIE